MSNPSQESSPIRTILNEEIRWQPDFEKLLNGAEGRYKGGQMAGIDRAEAALNTYVEERVREARIEEMNYMIAFGYTPKVRLAAIKEGKSATMNNDTGGQALSSPITQWREKVDSIFEANGQTVGYGDYYQTEALGEIRRELTSATIELIESYAHAANTKDWLTVHEMNLLLQSIANELRQSLKEL